MDAVEQIEFHAEDIDLPSSLSDAYKVWLQKIITNEGFELLHINYIFCSDEYLLEVNKTYLDHDYYTDIITFDNSDEEQFIESDIFISLERVAENAKQLGIEFEQELKRVMAHGVLHLCGYGDKTEEEAQLMREKENGAIVLFVK